MSKRYRNGKWKKDGLVSKVMKFPLKIDDDGQYIPYCNLQYHPGIVLREDVCISRDCRHYRKYYIGSIGRSDGDGQQKNNGQSECNY